MLILYMAVGIVSGLTAAGVTLVAGAGFGLAFLAYIGGGTIGFVAGALLLSFVRRPDRQDDFAIIR